MNKETRRGGGGHVGGGGVFKLSTCHLNSFHLHSFHLMHNISEVNILLLLSQFLLPHEFCSFHLLLNQ